MGYILTICGGGLFFLGLCTLVVWSLSRTSVGEEREGWHGD